MNGTRPVRLLSVTRSTPTFRTHDFHAIARVAKKNSDAAWRNFISFSRTFTPAGTAAAAAGWLALASAFGPRAATGANLPPDPHAADGLGANFTRVYLQELATKNPTVIQFGPDGRFYVAQADGEIAISRVERDTDGVYTAVEIRYTDLVRDIPNHEDHDGSPNPSVNTRLVTGMLVVGTAANPVIYVTSSDPRDHGPPNEPDTNSGILSRLTWNGSAWVKLDLVRGIPRSFEEHLVNGIALDPATNTLFLAVGGHTNMGAPSANFYELPEYALSGAILSVDLDAIGGTTYDLPTLDDEDRAGTNDANDPFGGNRGKNQARLVPGGPVQVYSPGYRNPYDLVRTSTGDLYTVDNGPNTDWGGPPLSCTNGPNEDGSQELSDNLHRVTAGFYAGHPNPTRASLANTFNPSHPQSPVSAANPVECTYRAPGSDGALALWPNSTNGLCEYRASNLGGGLKGNLLSASFSNDVVRFVLDPGGTTASVSALFSHIGNIPLDITAEDDDAPFPGTIWVSDYANGLISIYEPSDYGNPGPIPVPNPDPGSKRSVVTLGPPRPNPSTKEVTCDLTLAASSRVDAAVYDVIGRRVRALDSGTWNAGTRPLTWDGLDDRGRTVSPGVYLLKVTAGGRQFTEHIHRRP